MAIRAVTFDKQKCKSGDDGLSMSQFLMNSSCVIVGCEAIEGASEITISTGAFFICGRLIHITSTESVGIPSVPAGETRYMLLVFEVDMNQVNTETEFRQGQFKILSDSSDYPLLTQEDINGTGTLYKMPFAKFRADATGMIADSFVDERTLIKPISELEAEVQGKADSDDTRFLTTAQKAALTGGSDADAQHTHDGKADASHAHDSRYYTESEVDSKLSGKINTTGGTVSGNLTVTGNLYPSGTNKLQLGNNDYLRYNDTANNLRLVYDAGTERIIPIVIISTASPSGTYPDGTIWIKY